MAYKNPQRQVFISHAADDPDWPPEAIDAVATAISDTGVTVRLDLRHQQAMSRHLSPSEWRDWMGDAIRDASHILCLVSPRYQQLWQRTPEDPGGLGVAFEPIQMIHDLYPEKQGSHGRILTLRPQGRGYKCIPRDLQLDCAAYVWSGDRARLLSHLADTEVPSSNLLSDGLILDGLHYPEDDDLHASLSGELISSMPVESAGVASLQAVSAVSDIGEMSIILEANGTLVPGVTPSPVEVEQEKISENQRSQVSRSSIGGSGRWPAEDQWRAPRDFPPLWASAWGDDPYGLWADLTVNGVTQRMRWIEPSGPEGFWMGSTKQERARIKDKAIRQFANEREHDPRQMVVKEGFWLADTPCTQAFWTAVVGENPSHFKEGAEAPHRPVETVSWDDVMTQFIARFAATPEWGAGKALCLPSELEWEYAARAGTRTAYWWGDGWEAPHGNVDVTGKRNSDDKAGTTPVKRYTPSPWGLYDVHGNVWECCADVWCPRLEVPEARPDEDGRVVRGGSWFDLPDLARAAFRDRWHSRNISRYYGFRFALRSPGVPEARGGGAGR